jgi:1-aminocyclopropane-1-carboxylate deaminase/D-cysteine desulfhydrase-like pyridoxal-dependent ACC family enzyme
MSYVDAARELAAQVRAGEMPEPDACVVALGSGGTAAGLAAGFAAEGMKTEVVAVSASEPVAVLRASVAHLVRGCMRLQRQRSRDQQRDETSHGVPARAPPARWSVDARFLGRGYGYVTADGESAAEIGARVGLALDVTYTAKAFAAALAHAKASSSSRPRRVILYWHTLSSAPLAPLAEVADASARQAADGNLTRLVRLLAPGLPDNALPAAQKEHGERGERSGRDPQP